MTITCRICHEQNENIVGDVEDYLEIIHRIAQIHLIFDDNLSSKICDGCVNDLLNADTLRDMLLECNEPEKKVILTKTEIKDELYEEEVEETVEYDAEDLYEIIEEDVEIVDQPSIKCMVCPAEYETADQLNNHIVKCHSELMLDEDEDEPHIVIPSNPPPPKIIREKKEKSEKNERKRAPRIYVCHRCDLTVRSLPVHMKAEHPFDPPEFKCHYCDKMYPKISTLYSHINNLHSTKIMCDECGAEFNRHHRLRVHKLAKHMNIKEFQCEYCESRFARKGTLIAHLRKHTGEKPFKCKLCPKAYAHFSDYRTHEMSHTGEWSYFCSICSKGFYKPSTLKNHMKTH